MKDNSILLALSGSHQSRYAAEVAWRLSKQLGARITAHHVIDTHNAWQFIGHEKPGFIESEVYVTAYQNLCKSLFILAESLAEAYVSDAKKTGIDDACIVTEGNPKEEICRRAEEHNLVVIGHKPSILNEGAKSKYSEFVRLSLAESLSMTCPRPLLIVQGPCKAWSSLAIMISMEHINERYVNSCLDLAKALDLPALMVIIECGGNEEDLRQFVTDLRSENKRLANVPMTFSNVDQDIAVNKSNWFLANDQEVPTQVLDHSLFVMPTRQIVNDRLSVLNSPASNFVKFLNLPSILLWPEEFDCSMLEGKRKLTATSAEI